MYNVFTMLKVILKSMAKERWNIHHAWLCLQVEDDIFLHLL